MRSFFMMLAVAPAIYAAALDISDADRARCFIDNSAERTVTFVFDNNLWKVSSLAKVEVRGSFNGWKSSSEWAMTYDDESQAWILTVDYPMVRIPGNSGQPEFKFVTNGSTYQSGSSRRFIPEGYVFNNGDRNNIVVFDDDDFETIKANSAAADRIRPLADFDLDTRAGREEISNFRKVPATSALFRAYHPYKITKSSNPAEPVRMAQLTSLALEEGIVSDICLSENEEKNLKNFNIAGQQYTEAIPDYYRDIIDNGRVLYVGTANGSVPSYNEVYYNPAGTKFGQWVREIVDFINSDDSGAPYMIHCRLGTDRTGMFCGVIAALCGAGWNEIAADYQLSNRMGIQEFRDYHLLEYAFRQLLGVDDLADVDDVSAGICSYFMSKGILDGNDIEKLRHKLGAVSTSLPAVENASLPAEWHYFDISGRSVDAGRLSPGIYVGYGTDSRGKVRTEKMIVR